MPFYTPLRYPGGKRRLAPVVMRLLDENGLRNVQYAEPYAGGAAIALALLLEEYASVVHINDLSRPVFAFWQCVLHDNAELCRRIERTRVTMREWHRQRAVYDARDSADVADLGFATLFLNRTNRSGIIAGGVIGGKKQSGSWALDARFTKPELINRIRRIGRYSSRIKLYQMDALAFTKEVIPGLGANTFAFYDPPYIENSEDLYLNNYDLEGHRQIAAHVAALGQPWVVTYDHAAVRSRLYPAHRRMVYGLSYSAQKRYEGREVMFFSDRVRLPDQWAGGGSFMLTRPGNRYAVYGSMENMKPRPEVQEGPDALERFRNAMKTIVSTPKAQAIPPKSKPAAKPKKRRSPS